MRHVHLRLAGHVGGVVSQPVTGYVPSSRLSAPPSGGVPGSGGSSKSSVSRVSLPRTTTRVPLLRSWLGAISSPVLFRKAMWFVTIRFGPLKPVSNEYTSLPTWLFGSHADAPSAISLASDAVQSGTAVVSKWAPLGSCSWTCWTAGGLALASPASKYSSWKIRPDGVFGARVVKASLY